MAGKSKKWMDKAFANSHGQYKARAKAAGRSTAAEAKHDLADPGASTHVKRQAALAERGMAAGKGKSRSEKWYGGKGA